MTTFTKIDGMKNYINLKEAEKDSLLVEGKYTHRTLSEKFKSWTYFFKPLDGGPVTGVSGGHLTYLMEDNVMEGQLVQVVYKGMEKITKGEWKGTDSHQFELAVADSADQLGAAPVATKENSQNVNLSDLD